MLREHGHGTTGSGAFGTTVPVWRSFSPRCLCGYRGFAVSSHKDPPNEFAEDDETTVVPIVLGRNKP